MPRDVSADCQITIDKNGNWFYRGQQIIHHQILHSFHEALEMTHNGRFLVRMEDEICYIEAEDTPFVVTTLRGDQNNGLILVLNSGETHDLDAATLRIEADNQIYATLENGIPVRFTRPAYYQLGLMMDENADGIHLRIGNIRYPITSPGC